MSDDTYKGFYIYWIEEWSQFFRPCNWYTFHPIQIEVEDERNMGGVEATIIILGLGFRVRWNYTETDFLKGIRKQVEEIRADAALPKEVKTDG